MFQSIAELKIWLKRGQSAAREIKLLQERKLQSEQRITSLTRPIEKSIARVKPSRNDGALAAHSDFTSDIDTQIHRLEKILAEISDAIMGLDNSLHKQVLFSLYVLLKPLSVVADEMAYTIRHTSRIHRAGLTTLLEKLN